MKIYISILLTLILVALLGIGYILYQNFGLTLNGQGGQKQATQVQKDTFTTKEDNSNKTVFQEGVTGSVSGDICYPSEGIPPLTLYFKEIDTVNIVEYQSELNQSEYAVDDVPIGSYVAFAYVNGLDDDGGGYTQAVECGLTTECSDHTLIEFNVLENETTSGIDICDWYGAEVPDNL